MRFITAGESHGPELTTIIEGIPAGLALSAEDINKELARRQKGYGRGGRMKIEKDQVRFTSGVRHGKTLGSPITMIVENKDWENWQTIMSPEDIADEEKQIRRVNKPRPGHADLVGGIKYQHRDLRNVLERSSARETAMRVAVGAVAKKILRELDIEVAGHVVSIGGIHAKPSKNLTIEDIQELSEKSQIRMVDVSLEEEVKSLIDKTKENGDTIGGIVEVLVDNAPPGLGSYVQWDRKLDGKIAQAVISINGFKAVEFGIGFEMDFKPGSEVMDPILWNKEKGYTRASNNLGGFEGGMTNGMPIIVRGVFKPIPTLYKPLKSVNIDNKEAHEASIERSDSTAVPAASIVCEAVVATEIAKVIIEQFPSDSMERMKDEVEAFRQYAQQY